MGSSLLKDQLAPEGQERDKLAHFPGKKMVAQFHAVPKFVGDNKLRQATPRGRPIRTGGVLQEGITSFRLMVHLTRIDTIFPLLLLGTPPTSKFSSARTALAQTWHPPYPQPWSVWA
jgi:hypothetical protein